MNPITIWFNLNSDWLVPVLLIALGMLIAAAVCFAVDFAKAAIG